VLEKRIFSNRWIFQSSRRTIFPRSPTCCNFRSLFVKLSTRELCYRGLDRVLNTIESRVQNFEDFWNETRNDCRFCWYWTLWEVWEIALLKVNSLPVKVRLLLKRTKLKNSLRESRLKPEFQEFVTSTSTLSSQFPSQLPNPNPPIILLILPLPGKKSGSASHIWVLLPNVYLMSSIVTDTRWASTRSRAFKNFQISRILFLRWKDRVSINWNVIVAHNTSNNLVALFRKDSKNTNGTIIGY